jgi:hypothetical protein
MMGTDPIRVAGADWSGVGYLAVAAVVWNTDVDRVKSCPRPHTTTMNLSLLKPHVWAALIWLLATTVRNIVWFIITAMVRAGQVRLCPNEQGESHRAALDLFRLCSGCC